MPDFDHSEFNRILLEREVERFLYDEAELLDARQFSAWLDLLDDEFRLYVPITQNVRYDMKDQELSGEQRDMCWFDEGKETIRQRVEQIATGLHWAEEPRSRTTHMISNVRIKEAAGGEANGHVVSVSSAFLLYRNRGQIETDFLVGRRLDRLRRHEGSWKIERREVHLSQSVLLAKNLTTFF
ncbi:3-phenylpropionate/cinnamic acid dioxygenase subunit beta [Aminobacter aminovorans]|uniref:3-phenylpropionate/cinnamic acid dioxygenase small subunit n=1 Tax=Aminobacter aminovorans TaxID=83263 RepID=A0AAC9FD22_AMIAI|nr:3-phenylpropionate/cinnamic acid dioxygenase subunit beta [Aminobacter aminovorans]AMS40127.1 hypothetical protein AA2016_1191 [Aminobacter aminovorans]MBB3710134.1 3-phenylpropionate/cinnamic acid dioxygenase small subunit [Aminobacter aminovorans]